MRVVKAPRLGQLVIYTALLALLWGCGESLDSAPPPSEREVTPAMPIEQHAVDHSVEEVAPVTVVPSKPLDLALPEALDSTVPQGDDPSEKRTLPDLFNQPRADKETTLSGKLLSDPDNPDPIKSVEGVEITIEKKTR